MPYYNTGIDFRVYPWIQGDVKSILTYNPAASATWQDFLAGTVFDPDYAVLIKQPTHFEINFNPYNTIPSTGFILIKFPNCSTCDWGVIDPYCTVANGLTDAGCDIDPTERMITISGWIGDYTYDDIADNLIKVTFNVENPTTAGLDSEKF